MPNDNQTDKATADSPAAHGSEVPTPRTDRWEYEQECNFDVTWEDNCRLLERENKMLADALVKAAGYLASVRTDRKKTDTDGNVWALQTMEWAEGALEYAEAANAALETYDAAGLPNESSSPTAGGGNGGAH
jgi:hypothetical protein